MTIITVYKLTVLQVLNNSLRSEDLIFMKAKSTKGTVFITLRPRIGV